MATRRRVARWAALLVLTLAPPALAERHAYTEEQCPVVGNKFSGIYHTPKNANYWQMLERNQNLRVPDNRECFESEEAARAADYRPSRAFK
jgi:hypothetical protein